MFDRYVFWGPNISSRFGVWKHRESEGGLKKGILCFSPPPPPPRPPRPPSASVITCFYCLMIWIIQVPPVIIAGNQLSRSSLVLTPKKNITYVL